MEEIDGIEVDLSLLTDGLQALAPLLRAYSVSDDLERASRLESASPVELRALVTAGAPHWQAINAYLDEHMQPPGAYQDVALVLDGFAQTAMEAELALRE
jgi:hypothetical protein